jgi:alpha-galactosidase/6-phospho-beta-glucosidase family protein
VTPHGERKDSPPDEFAAVRFRPNLPEDAIIEVPAKININGYRTVRIGKVPLFIKSFTRTLIAWQDLTVEAALTGSPDIVLQAVIAHPWPAPTDKKRDAVNAMFRVHREWLPQFKNL